MQGNRRQQRFTSSPVPSYLATVAIYSNIPTCSQRGGLASECTKSPHNVITMFERSRYLQLLLLHHGDCGWSEVVNPSNTQVWSYLLEVAEVILDENTSEKAMSPNISLVGKLFHDLTASGLDLECSPSRNRFIGACGCGSRCRALVPSPSTSSPQSRRAAKNALFWTL